MQLQQVTKALVFLALLLGLTQLPLQIGYLRPEIVVLLLQVGHLVKVVADAAEPARHGGACRPEG